MSGVLKDLPPQAIVLTSADATDYASSSTNSMIFRVSLGDVRDTEGLIRVVALELMFPHEASGFDALLDLMSDLDWFGNEAGYVVQFDDLDQLAEREPELLTRFVALLPNLCDRWRSRDVPFRLVLRCQRATRRQIRGAIDVANAELQMAALQPWLPDLSPAEVVECVECGGEAYYTPTPLQRLRSDSMMSTSWVAVRELMRWLSLPPYLVAWRDLPRLRSELREHGFKVFEADAQLCSDERSLLIALGAALPFPDYYGANWAAFEDCIGDILRENAGATALVVVGVDEFLTANVHAFVRSVHLLSDLVTEVERAGSEGFQFEVFFVGDFQQGTEGS